MIGEKKSREEFLASSLKEFVSIENAVKRIYARIPYVCNLSKGTGDIDDCKRVLGLTVDRNEVSDMNRELSLFKLSIESSVSKISSQTGMLKKGDGEDSVFDKDIIRTARIISSRITDFSKYVATQASLPESDIDTANKFLLKTNSEFGVRDIFNSIRDKIKSIQDELLDIRSKNKFSMKIPCGVNDATEKEQIANFMRQVILSTEPALEDSLSIPKSHHNGFLEFHFNSLDSAEKARAAILVSFKQSNAVSINISKMEGSNLNKKSLGTDFSI